ncbi:MAG: DNA repair protein [Porphyrobacter sp.]|nr:DNA repair protein [Porphyrobacter sp.]
MVIGALAPRPAIAARPEQRLEALFAHLRTVVLASDTARERCQVIFLDESNRGLGDASFGLGNINSLALRMRTLFGEALRVDARGMILAHNHPSGHCRPSGCDIAATRKLAEVARALDIALVDHLIFTEQAVYSMRAGGLL